MGCDHWTEAISAIADGEDAGIDPRLVEAHVARCAACRTFRDDVESLRRPSRIAPAPVMPDLSRHIVKRNAIADRASAWGAVRILLAAVAAQIAVLSAPALLLGEQADTSTHGARHLGAFGVAYAVALLVVVVRPARARAILPVAAMLAGALLITALLDIAEGRVPLAGEALHLPEVLSVVFVWLLATPAGRRFRRAAPAPGRHAPTLRLVDEAANPTANPTASASGE
jgi:predicted anti-sigma-YlaC factor YlaD